MGILFLCLVGCFSMIIWTPTVLSVLCACVLYFCICISSAQLSMFHMERRSRNTLIIIFIIYYDVQMNFVEFGITTLQSYSEDDLFSASATGATSQTFPTVALCHFKTYDKLKAKGRCCDY